MGDDILVRLTVYNDVLVITGPPLGFEHPDWTPIGPGKIGCVLAHSERHLGISEEALRWLREVPASRDDIGDVMWFATTNGGHAFGWLGAPRALKRRGADGQKGFRVFDGAFVVIPNDVPEAAVAVIDAKGSA